MKKWTYLLETIKGPVPFVSQSVYPAPRMLTPLILFAALVAPGASDIHCQDFLRDSGSCCCSMCPGPERDNFPGSFRPGSELAGRDHRQRWAGWDDFCP